MISYFHCCYISRLLLRSHNPQRRGKSNSINLSLNLSGFNEKFPNLSITGKRTCTLTIPPSTFNTSYSENRWHCTGCSACLFPNLISIGDRIGRVGTPRYCFRLGEGVRQRKAFIYLGDLKMCQWREDVHPCTGYEGSKGVCEEGRDCWWGFLKWRVKHNVLGWVLYV
jgi:hypothetical protein